MDTYRLPANLLKVMAHPARLRLLNALRAYEECVCHLTALLHERQAYVSQQLMFMRQAGLLEDRRDGLRVYYRIRDPRLFQVLDAVIALTGGIDDPRPRHAVTACSCPKCERERRAQQKSSCRRRDDRESSSRL
jgi:DNA-binding transcriptional ArsR family regulator